MDAVDIFGFRLIMFSQCFGLFIVKHIINILTYLYLLSLIFDKRKWGMRAWGIVNRNNESIRKAMKEISLEWRNKKQEIDCSFSLTKLWQNICSFPIDSEIEFQRLIIYINMLDNYRYRRDIWFESKTKLHRIESDESLLHYLTRSRNTAVMERDIYVYRRQTCRTACYPGNYSSTAESKQIRKL